MTETRIYREYRWDRVGSVVTTVQQLLEPLARRPRHLRELACRACNTSKGPSTAEQYTRARLMMGLPVGAAAALLGVGR